MEEDPLAYHKSVLEEEMLARRLRQAGDLRRASQSREQLVKEFANVSERWAIPLYNQRDTNLCFVATPALLSCRQTDCSSGTRGLLQALLPAPRPAQEDLFEGSQIRDSSTRQFSAAARVLPAFSQVDGSHGCSGRRDGRRR